MIIINDNLKKMQKNQKRKRGITKWGNGPIIFNFAPTPE